MEVAEIAVRFDNTTLDVAHVTNGTYRIGTAPDVDLALVGLTSFPLISWTATDRCMLRIPVGLTARRTDGTPVDGGLLLRRGDEIELSTGLLVIRVSLIARIAALPRPRIDARWSGWIACTLAVHLLALGLADAFATPEPEGVHVPSIASLIPRPADPELPARVRVVRKPDPSERRATAAQPRTTEVVAVVEPNIEQSQSEPARRNRAIAGARRAGMIPGIRAADIKAIAGTIDLDKAMSEVGPIYREHDATKNGFGNGRRWDPTKDPRFDSVATGRYATVSGGRATGDHHALPGEVGKQAPPRLEHCTGTCTATGGTTRDTIRSVLSQRSQTILDCYDRHGKSARGTVVVELEIGADGKISRAYGDGLGDTAGCVASVVKRTAFPAASATTATYSMSFTPS